MRPVLVVVGLLAMASPAHAQVDRVLKGLGGLPGGGSGLSDARIGAGLQDFRDFETLKKIGKRTLDLTLALPRE